MIIELDMNSSIPIYVQLRNQIVMGIGHGELKPGESLPTVRQLAEDAGVNTMRVNKTYQILKTEGYINIDRRHGAVVAKNIDIVKYTKDLLEIIQHDMYERAKERRDKLTFEAHNLDEMKQILETQPGFIHAMWCGNPKCEEKIKEIRGCKSRCILENKALIDDKCVCCGSEAKYYVVWGIQY